ncbi:formiminoglutamate deiminase [Antricoccus suffuscus]|uniref:Formiminoglutamate deiminase n=1 Tax=Antricoccus suffuscus TaxID=1629062 RepID=A0A2T0ZXU5_9ACTN|nr:formimidoylglutamate deiminase [Antricoccus suffuscus]PRZ41175.1 formiminoglutamate deiminase [Antricoccus suffuscus]
MNGAWRCEHAVIGDRVLHDVTIEYADGAITAVGSATVAGARNIHGLVIPGLANAHSHAFHRALRGRTQRGHGSFWTWREQMYAVAATLNPDSYLALATATFAEMALAGITCVGEFHYLHHLPDGTSYGDENAMGKALIQAAHAAGIRITLLDTCYVAGGFGVPLEGTQLRFSDVDAEQWALRVDALRGNDYARIGAAVHSVRGVPAEQIPTVARWATVHDAPLHVHLSEQVAENDQCLAHYGHTPTEVLHEAGALGSRTSAVHATHLQAEDLRLLGTTHTTACFCPTTERDLADGIGPARALFDLGSPLSLGSDSHAVIDILEEARAVELNARLDTQQRGHFSAAELLGAATRAGHASLGWHDTGTIEVGARADLVALSLGSVRTAGAAPDSALETAIFAASAADVTDVLVDGRAIVVDRAHQLIDDVPGSLSASIEALQ